MQERNYNPDNSLLPYDPIKNELWKDLISLPVFFKPAFYSQSAWTEHIPFAFWLIDAAKPKVFVELGTHYGLSYFSFCQAVSYLQLQTKCFAIDNWLGDEHAGFYEDSVFTFVSNANNPYSNFSTLRRSSFDESVSFFADNSIDILHIDGFHTYEAAKHDFYMWLPKISKSGVVVFHDTNVREKGFGVYKLWDEISKEYPSFEFKHGFGLGILGVGEQVPERIDYLFKADEGVKAAIRGVYERLGYLCKIEEAGIQEIKEYGKSESPEDGSKIVDYFLKPLNILEAQVFWVKHNDDFNETNSVIQQLCLSTSAGEYLFKLDQEFSNVKKVRIDFTNQPGVFYLNSVSIVDTEGKIILDWEIIRKICVFRNSALVKSSINKDLYLFIAITEDPIIEIELPPIITEIVNNQIGFVINASCIDVETAGKELINILRFEFKNEFSLVPDQLQLFNQILQSTKTDLSDIISQYKYDILADIKAESVVKLEKLDKSTSDIIIQLKEHYNICFQQVEKNTSFIIKEMQDQGIIFDSIVKDLNRKIQIKEDIIVDITKKLENDKTFFSGLQDQISQKSTEVESISIAYKAIQDEHKNLNAKILIEMEVMENQRIKLAREISERDNLLLDKQKEILESEQIKEELKKRIFDYEHISIWQFIKKRIKPKKIHI